MMPGGLYKYDDASKTLHVYPSREFDLPPIDSRGEDRRMSICETMIIHDGVNELFNWQFIEAFNCKKLVLPESVMRIGQKCFFSSPIECVEIGRHVSVYTGAFANTKVIKWNTSNVLDVLVAIREGRNTVLWQSDLGSIRLAPEAGFVFAGAWSIKELASRLNRFLNEQQVIRATPTSKLWKYMQMYIDIADLGLEDDGQTERHPKRLAKHPQRLVKHLLCHPEGISDEDYMGLVRFAGFTSDVLDVINEAGKPQIAAWFLEQCKAGDKPKSDFDL